jgi:crotonobetainyl-CoA:carnitine CoA-transferase CaiB-like acyl-CoA transferase
MSGILEGVKVVSMELMEATPAATCWLGDWGADVIKIEPLTGDQFRGTRRIGGRSVFLNIDGAEVNPRFELLNRNKKSLAVDLKQESGREILYKLVKEADVFMTNNEANALKTLKADYETLSQVNPKIVYAFLNAYGTAGPDKDGPGYDRVSAWARAGFQYLIGEPGGDPPTQRSGMMDRTVAPHIVSGVLAALLHKEKTGEGQKIEVSLYQSAVWTLAGDIQVALVAQQLPKDNRSQVANPLWSSYRTRDNRWLCLGMLRPDPYWGPLCKVIERPELENDPRFENMGKRTENRVELINILDEIFMSKDIAEWEELCREHKLIWSRVQSPKEITQDPQALANDFFVDLNHPSGHVPVVASPVKFIQNPASVRGPAPEIGQNTEEILLEYDYTWEDLGQLKEQGVIL